jgi:hypothetical protein
MLADECPWWQVRGKFRGCYFTKRDERVITKRRALSDRRGVTVNIGDYNIFFRLTGHDQYFVICLLEVVCLVFVGFDDLKRRYYETSFTLFLVGFSIFVWVLRTTSKYESLRSSSKMEKHPGLPRQVGRWEFRDILNKYIWPKDRRIVDTRGCIAQSVLLSTGSTQRSHNKSKSTTTTTTFFI